MVDVGVGVGVMPAPHGNPVNLSLLNPGKTREDKNRTAVMPETEAACNYPPSTSATAPKTPISARSPPAGVIALTWVGGAWAYHQYHPSPDPPVQHLTDIVRNAAISTAGGDGGR